MAAGRPPFDWTEEIEGEILSRIMGGEPVSHICDKGRDDWLPSEQTFYKRLAADSKFAEKYARARQVQAHREFEEIRSIADEADNENVQVARLRIDARKWRASKMAPKVYGDKLGIGGADDLPPIKTEQTGADKLAAFLNDLEERSRASGEPSAE